MVLFEYDQTVLFLVLLLDHVTPLRVWVRQLNIYSFTDIPIDIFLIFQFFFLWNLDDTVVKYLLYIILFVKYVSQSVYYWICEFGQDLHCFSEIVLEIVKIGLLNETDRHYINSRFCLVLQVNKIHRGNDLEVQEVGNDILVTPYCEQHEYQCHSFVKWNKDRS